jgi:hypothetical protein
LLNDHQILSGSAAGGDTLEYKMAQDTLKIYLDFLDEYIPYGFIRNDQFIFIYGGLVTITPSSRTETSNILPFSLEDGLQGLGYDDPSDMQAGDTIAISNTSFHYLRN